MLLCIEWWNCFWTFLTAAGTILIAILAYFQLNRIRKISKADLAHRYRNDFFTTETRDLFMLFEYEQIEFKFIKLSEEEKDKEAKYFYYFELLNGKHRYVKEENKQTVSFINKMLNIKDNEDNKSCYYSSNEIDDLLLSHFENLEVFCQKGFVDNDFIYEAFSYYLLTLGENEQIKKYKNHLNISKKDNDFYRKFDDLYNRFILIRYEKMKKINCKK